MNLYRFDLSMKFEYESINMLKKNIPPKINIKAMIARNIFPFENILELLADELLEKL